MSYNPENTPVHYRWTIGPAAPIQTGEVTGPSGGIYQIIVTETAVEFLRVDMVAGPPYGVQAPVGVNPQCPVGADLVVDVLRSTDGGNTFASALGANPLPRLADGRWSQTTGGQGPFCLFLANQGDYLRLNVVQCGSIQPGQAVGFCLYGQALAD